jgi:hypothetical protein
VDIINLITVTSIELAGGICLALGAKHQTKLVEEKVQAEPQAEWHVHELPAVDNTVINKVDNKVNNKISGALADDRRQIKGGSALEQAQTVLLEYLMCNHGTSAPLGNSNINIARALGVDKGTLRLAAAALADNNIIRIDARRNVGTRYTLVKRDSVH